MSCSENKEASTNTLEFPIRPGEVKCKQFLRFGTCKYGAECRFDHPPGEKGTEEEFPVKGMSTLPDPVGIVEKHRK
jgi:hypothetical protein